MAGRYQNPRNIEPRVPIMVSASDVYDALYSHRAQSDSLYVRAVLRSYIEIKLARGKTPYEAGTKLEIIERQMPEYAQEFQFIRRSCNLPPSRVLPDPSLSNAFDRRPNRSSIGSNRRLSAASNATGSPSVIRLPASPRDQPVLRRQATPPPQPLAQAVEDGSEPPPPPYATQDPDPDSTRLLQERLAAEAQARGQDPMTLIQSEAGSSRGAGTNSLAESSRTTANSARVSEEVSNRARFSPPPGPPPSNSVRLSSEYRSNSDPRLGRTSSPRFDISTLPPEREASPPRRPPSLTEPEEVEAWEQSQLDEATRASMLMEQERLDLEEAMRLSLAEAEAHMAQQSSREAAETTDMDVGGMRGVGAGTSSGNSLFNLRNDDNDNLKQDPRRFSSYRPLMTSGPIVNHPLEGTSGGPLSGSGLNHRRTVSEGPNQYMPGSWSQSPDEAKIPSLNAPTPSSTHPNQSIIDLLSAIDFDQPSSSNTLSQPPISAIPLLSAQSPLSPTPTSSLSVPSSRPVARTMQSRNPFLSPQEREELEAQDNWLDSGTPTPSRDQPGSSYSTSTMVLPPLHSRRELPPTPNGEVNHIDTLSVATMKPLPTSPGLTPPVPPRPLSTSTNDSIPFGPRRKDPLQILKEYDIVFLGERWSTAKRAITDVATQAAQYDDEGFDIHFVNSKRVGKGLKSADDVEDLFAGLEPRGSTPTGLKLESILRDYMGRLEQAPFQVKPMNLIVVTDGVFALPVSMRLRINPSFDRRSFVASAPRDDPEGVLVACAERLDRGDFPLTQVGVQLLQIGDDAEAREALQQLHVGLSAVHGVRDMVDTVQLNEGEMTAALIFNVLLGGINRRQDRR